MGPDLLHHLARLAGVLLLVLVPPVIAATAPIDVHGIRLWRSPDKTRLVFEVSGTVTHNTFFLTNPQRFVIDLPNTRLKTALARISIRNTPIRRLRHGVRQQRHLRIVLDLKRAVTANSFLLKPNAAYGHRLVIDLYDQDKPAISQQVASVQQDRREVVVAIDAGHGGEDPGALAHGGGHEKHIVLAIARQLATLLKKAPGFKPVLIRDGDYYIELRERSRLARRHNADLFVSIHADGFKDTRTQGASVYALSRLGATSETARWLAQKENSADQIGGEDGISLKDKDDLLAGVLLDLAMTSTLSSSLDVGDKILRALGQVNPLHKEHVEQAAFVVLKSPDMPSILVETGFITNPQEARKLKSPRHQQAIAHALFKGIRNWFIKRPPVGTLLAKWQREGKLQYKPDHYVIQAGDTLSHIAERFSISLDSLRKANKLSHARATTIQTGQVLVIPN